MKKYPRFKCFKEYNRLLKEYHDYRKNLPEETLVAYVTSGAPVEILEAMDIVTVYPENFGALCGVAKISSLLCSEAEQKSYPADLCAYAKGHIAASLDPKAADPLEGLPKPDLLLCCTNICGTVLPWYQRLAEIYECPLFVLDVPFRFSDEEENHVIDYIKDQLTDLIKEAGTISKHHSGTSFDMARLEKVMALSKQAIDLWTDIRSLGKQIPSPLNVSDLFLSMAPVVVMRGRQEAVDFYRLMKKEVEERISAGIAAVPGEKHRLLWDNIAIWADLFRFYRFFAEADACFVADTYTGAWSIPFSLEDPLVGLARAYAAPYINLNMKRRLEVIDTMASEYHVNGIVMHANRSCKPFSFAQGAIRRGFTETAGLPVLTLEADMCDLRSYNREALQERISAFWEILAS